jgi:FkbM family methyltransferase
MDSDLIYDVGMNDGSDTAFYLHKGYRVVAIEANPVFFDKAEKQFAEEVRSGRLILLNLAVSETEGEADFYVNLRDSHWSSLDPAWGTRHGTPFKTIKVQTSPFLKLMEKYGTPHYLKIDIEGADRIVLQQLGRSAEKPKFISVEEHDLDYFPMLWGLGYRGFKIVDQSEVPRQPYKGWQFEQNSSGPFGDDVPGPWLPFGDAILDYMLNIRDCRDRRVFSKGWFDIHGTLDMPALAENQPYPSRRTPAP